MPSFILLLCKFATTTNNMIYNFISFLTQSAHDVFLDFVNLCLKFALILWFCAATIRLSVSLFKSPFWTQTQLCSLLISLICLKYCPCKAFSSQSCNLFSVFAFFKTLAASKPSTLSISPSSLYQSFLNSMNIHLQTSNCQLHTIFNIYKTSSSIFSKYIQSVNIRLWVQSSLYCKPLPGFPIYSLQLTLFPTNKCC